MKKLLWISAVVILVITLNSCEKQELQNDVQDQEVQNSIDNPTLADMPDVQTFEGMLWFENEEQFNEVIDLLGIMSDDERTKWEESLGFVSLNSVYNKAYEELENAKTKEEFYNLLNQKTDLFRIEKFGDDDRIVENTDIFYIKYISNKNTMFLIQDTAYRLIDNNIVKTTKANYLELTNDNIDITNFETVDLSNNNEISNENIENESKTCHFQYTYSQNAIGGRAYYINCDHDRAVWIRLENHCHSYYYGWNSFYNLSSWTEKKNFWGTWVRYNCTQSLGLVEVEINNYNQSDLRWDPTSSSTSGISKNFGYHSNFLHTDFTKYNVWAKNSAVSEGVVRLKWNL